MKRSIFAASIATIVLAGITLAQVAEKKTLTAAGAERVIRAAMREANSKKTTGVIAVVDDGGNLAEQPERSSVPVRRGAVLRSFSTIPARSCPTAACFPSTKGSCSW